MLAGVGVRRSFILALSVCSPIVDNGVIYVGNRMCFVSFSSSIFSSFEGGLSSEEATEGEVTRGD